MDWAKQGDVLPPAQAGDPDRLRAWQPRVLEEDDGTLRMWYSGHDGTTGRVLEAVRLPGRSWHRLGVAVDAGLAGDTDRYGVEASCVVKLSEGYLMVYGGFDGRHSRIHLATSSDGHRWASEGPIVSVEGRPPPPGGRGMSLRQGRREPPPRVGTPRLLHLVGARGHRHPEPAG